MIIVAGGGVAPGLGYIVWFVGLVHGLQYTGQWPMVGLWTSLTRLNLPLSIDCAGNFTVHNSPRTADIYVHVGVMYLHVTTRSSRPCKLCDTFNTPLAQRCVPAMCHMALCSARGRILVM